MIVVAVIAAILGAADLGQELEAIQQRVSAVRSVEARFTERRFTALLREPMVRVGTLQAVAGISRWETTSPDPSTTIVTGEAVRIYYPQDKLLEIWEISSPVGRLASSPIPDLATIRTLFIIEAAGDADPRHLALRLTPIDETLRRHVGHVRLDLDRANGIVTRMEVAMVGGDRTEVVLDRVKLDTGITADDLALRVPPDTREVRRRPPGGNGDP